MPLNEPKKDVCVPAHLTQDEAIAVAVICSDEDITKSKYLRRLVIADLRMRAGTCIIAHTSRIATERLERIEL